MTAPKILVLTTVHHPDDTRIRERLIRTIEHVGRVTYATKEPGPADLGGLEWAPLRRGRLRRNLGAARLLLRRGWDLVVLHDPETIPIGVLARLVRRIPVVVDVHEDLAAQISSKDWVPTWSRPLFRWLARALYWVAEQSLLLTLAEPGYQRLFKSVHPVFPNYPRSNHFPEPMDMGDGSAIYVGDMTRARGIEEAVMACGVAGVDLVAVGRIEQQLEGSLVLSATDLTFTGPLPNPEAMRRVASASVGLSPLRDEPNYRHSLPTKTLEYLALGVPVVATDLPGTRSVLAGREAVWMVPAGDVDAMASAIIEAVQPDAKAAAVKQARSIRATFRWPEGEVRSFYAALISQKGTRGPS